MNTTACISAIALLGMIGMVTAYEELETFFPTENDSEDVSADKRYYLSPSCRRCMHNRNDYAACANCYSRTGPIPYYGTAKRSFEDLSSFLPVPYDRTRSKRGSFLACKCCLSLHRSNCCYRCGYFGPEKRSEYQPSFTDLYSAADCSCCNAGAFDFGCCLRCTRKRKWGSQG